MRGLRLGLGFGRTQGGAPFNVSFTGLSTDSLGTYGEVGNHAAISYTITPDLGTETVKWSNSSNPADAATFGTGANPTTFASVDGFSVYLHVTDGAETRSFSFSARYAPGTASAIADGQTFTVDSAITPIDASASGANLTFSYALTGGPAGLSINASTGEITGTPTAASSGTATVTATDQYGRTYVDTFTYTASVSAGAAVLSAFGSGSVDDLELDPPEVVLESTQAGTCYWDFHSTTTDPGQGNGDIGSGSFAVSAGLTETSFSLTAFGGETGQIFFRVVNGNGTSNVLMSQEITVPSADLVFIRDVTVDNAASATPTVSFTANDIQNLTGNAAIGLVYSGGSNVQISSLTIGGQTATRICTSNPGSAVSSASEVWEASGPFSTDDVVITATTTLVQVGVALFDSATLTGNAAQSATSNTNDNDGTKTVATTCDAGDKIIGVFSRANTSTTDATLTGATTAVAPERIASSALWMVGYINDATANDDMTFTYVIAAFRRTGIAMAVFD